MKPFTSLIDVWSFYDDLNRKNFLLEDISAAINSLPKDMPCKEVCTYEAMAFEFSENSNGEEWGTYYGARFTFRKKGTGEEVYVPDLKNVTKEMLDYWERRCQEVTNPLLKMRYTGLVLEFKKKLFNQEPDYRTIKLAHIQALLDVVEGDYCQYETVAFDYAERALSLSVRFKNQKLQQQVVKAYYDAHRRYNADDLKPGVWGRIFQSLTKHRLCFSEFEEGLVQEQLSRYKRLYQHAIEEGHKTDTYVHVLCDQVDLLADYYHSIGETEKIGPYFDSLLEAINISVAARGGIWGQGMIQQLQHRYRKYGFDKKANRLFINLSDLGQKTLIELNPTEYSIPLDAERIKAYLDEALKGSDKEVLLFFLFEYLPRIDDEKKRLKEKAERTPLLDLVSTFTIDSSGNTISRVGIGPNAEHQKLYFSMYENMRFIIPFMHLHITKMKEKGKMTTESMMSLLDESPLIPNDHKEIVLRGLNAYMEEDYLVSCHLLVPQLEAAIRRLFSLNGLNIMRPKANPDEGNEYLSLDSLLGSDDALRIMKEDMANYLRNVLTDQYGWNIRNQVSHGLLATDSFNFGMADRVVHAFLMLCTFREVHE